MDAVELARQRAASMHDLAVSKGADPWDSYALACAVAGELGLSVEPVVPGSAGLMGGRAQFDPDADAIRHENCGSGFDRGFLVAHELGHATLGDNPGGHVAHDVDPTRPAEAAPVGEERVADYSRRQRREIQMDLFGRELLLPRSRARALHLEGMSASEIAGRLKAPFDAVAQQLLDALLLPEVPPEEASAPKKRTPNEKQRKAAAHRGTAYLLEAGPGTGKTQTLVARIVALADEGVDPRDILALTFSNKAAGELSDRIAHTHQEAAAAMWVGTFHAFGLDIVRMFHKDLGFAREPRLMDRTEAVALLEKEYLSLGLHHHEELWDPTEKLRDMLSAISRAKDEVVGAERFAVLAQAMQDKGPDAEAKKAGERCSEVAKVYARYEEIKREAGAVDFGDLVSLPVTLLESNGEARNRIRAKYKHVLVDEYQDVNRSSIRLLQCLTDGGQGLWAVGDARQAIYRFRGASSYNMAGFGDDFKNTAGDRLEINYRSTPEIVQAVSLFGEGMTAGTGEAHLEADRPSEGFLPNHISFDDNDVEPDALRDEIEALKPTVGYRGQALLCFSNGHLARLGRELERRGIPVLYLGNLFERPEVKDLLSLLLLLIDKRAMSLVRKPTLMGLEDGLSLSDAAVVIDHLRQTGTAPLGWITQAPQVTALSAEGRGALQRLAAILSGFGPDARPWDVLSRVLLDRTRVAANISADETVAIRAQGIAIWQLMSFLRAERKGPSLPIQHLLDTARRLVQLADERDLRQLPLAAQGIDAVRLMTIHGSKGLEFPAVHLTGLTNNSLPSSPRRPACPVPDGLIEGGSGGTIEIAARDHAQEQECIFYVATSRARDRLLLYSGMRDGRGKKTPSDYLKRVGHLKVRTARAPAERFPDPELAALPIRLGRPISLTTAQLALYGRCPRRFLYTHVLSVGGKRTATTLTRMHDIVRAVVTELASLEPADATHGVAAARLHARLDESELMGPEFDPHRSIAAAMIARFVDARAGGQRIEGVAFRAEFGSDAILALPDEVLVDARGMRVARMIKTGRAGSKAGRTPADAAFQVAATQALPGAVVEILHLSDDKPVPISLKSKSLDTQLEHVATALAEIAAGHFRPVRSDWNCLSCPTLFICGRVVNGTLQKNL